MFVGFSLIHALSVLHGRNGNTELFSFDVKLAKFLEVVDYKVVESDSFHSLTQGVFVPVNLGKDGAELHLKPSDDK